MKYNPEIHHRRSIRLKGYDYSQAGLYFITICTQNSICLFGSIENDKMVLNNAGSHVNKCWLAIPDHYPNTQLHEYIIMPNHIHGIIQITPNIVGANNHSPCSNGTKSLKIKKSVNDSGLIERVEFPTRANDYSPLPAASGTSKTIGSVVRGFKIGVTKWFRAGMGSEGNYNPYQRKGTPVWQRNYWEHIIRNENEYFRISEYIKNNPAKWDNDKLNGGTGNQVLERMAEFNAEAWMI